MFTKSHFSIDKAEQYPPFFRVIQSVHSPLLGNLTPQESSHTAIVTIGLWRERFSEQLGTPPKGMSVCSVYHGLIQDPKELLQRVEFMKEDYLNKTLKRSQYSRPCDETLTERKRVSRTISPLYGKIEPLTYFYPELFGGERVEDRMVAVIPALGKLRLMKLPDSEELRADDGYLLSMMLSFPSVKSYSLAAALVQAVMYANQRWL